MKLRSRQVQFRDRCVSALQQKRNTLGVAPTGAGKTVMLSAVAGSPDLGVKKGLIMQHRDELVEQNERTFNMVNPHISTGYYNAKRKETWPEMIFGMVQTLAKADPADLPAIDFLGVDEAHHSAADSYMRLIHNFYQKNPDMILFGVTATPQRGDRKALSGIYNNCADQITLKELIAAGHLVKPRSFVVDIGVQSELQGVRRTALDFDMNAVEAIMDRQVLNDAVVEQWKQRAGDRRTVVFCSTIAHMNHVSDAFTAAGVSNVCVDGSLAAGERKKRIADFDAGKYQVILNVAVLTEGWDCQPVSCVILLRPSSYKSTMIQMIGRGLRKLDPERYPGIEKDDCMVLDFGTSLLMHGDLEQNVYLEGTGTKECPGCQSELPGSVYECPICGHEFEHEIVERGAPGEKEEAPELKEFIMTEIDVLEDSPLKWIPIFNGMAMVATAFDAWAVIVYYQHRWHAIGACNEKGVVHLENSADKILALSTADDFMRTYGDTKGAAKSKDWMRKPMTENQRKCLGIDPSQAFQLNRYEAGCYITWQKAEKVIEQRLADASRQFSDQQMLQSA